MSRLRSGEGQPEAPTRVQRSRTGLRRTGATPAGTDVDPRRLVDDEEPDEAHAEAQAEPPPEPVALAGEVVPAGERSFGRYTLLRRLAFGGMGEIFLARQGGVGSLAQVAKLVVIKRILGHVRHDDRHRRMFLDEARLQALLADPHIVQIHDMGEENGHVYLAMEHVHGPSWRALVERCRKNQEFIPLGFVCDMVAQAARGLSYAHNLVDGTGHDLKIVHRDVNPHNVLVTYDGVVKIIDFGIAKSELADGQTETGAIKGKYNYMSPEQSAAKPLDRRSDLFTLGVCLYELITLRNPFRRGNVVLTLDAIQREIAPLVEERRPEAAAFQPILDLCLAKKRDERFDDCEQLAEALEELVSTGAVPPPPAPLAVWLRERFADQIAEHAAILEQTGSAAALVVRSSDPNATPRKKASDTGSHSALRSLSGGSGSRVRPVPVPAVEANRETHRGLEVEAGPNLDLEDPLAGLTGARTALFDTEPAPEPGAELTSKTSSHAMPVQASVDVPPDAAALPTTSRRRARVAAWIGVVVLLAAGAGAALLFRTPRSDNASSKTQLSRADDLVRTPSVPAPVPFEKDADRPTQPLSTTPTVSSDAGVDAASVDGGALAPATEPSAPIDVETAQPAPDVGGDPARGPRSGSGRRRPVPQDKSSDRPIAGVLVVQSEGYQVRGSREIPLAGSTVLSIVDKSAPFRLSARVRADAEGRVTFDVDTDPWAIVVLNGLGQGRTPLRGLALPSNGPARLELKNPQGARMTFSLSLRAR